MDFIAKPLSEEQVIPLYETLGLHYAVSAHTEIEPQDTLEVTPLAKFREVANIALGKGAAIMADHLREFIQLPVPHVGPLSYGELHMTLVDVIGRDSSVAVAQRFVGEVYTERRWFVCVVKISTKSANDSDTYLNSRHTTKSSLMCRTYWCLHS